MSSYHVTRRFEFDAAHRLMNHDGKCFRPHGHRYIFDVTLAGSAINEVGYFIDFKDLDAAIEEGIGDWDHRMLLEQGDPIIKAFIGLSGTVYTADVVDDWLRILPVAPSIENMTAIATGYINAVLEARGLGHRVTMLTGYETPNCWCRYVPFYEEETS